MALDSELGRTDFSVMEIHKGLEEVDDDGRPRRTGTLWTASAHIVTSVIGSGVLSLSWCLAQLGWVAGCVALLCFSVITYFTSMLLADCYRTPDPVYGKRNYSYMEAVRANLGGMQYMICGFTQYVNIIGISIGYTITASISMAAVNKSNCYHKKGHNFPCEISNNPYMISFGIVQIILSQIPNIHKLSWLSTLAAIMSFCYASIGVVLSIVKLVSGNSGHTTLGGVEIGPSLTEVQKVWKTFSALGDIAFSYTISLILIEIQDTLRSPAENKEMKKATMISVITTTVFYVLCGCVGYAAFGNNAPGNMLTGFGFYEPFWLIDFANVCIVVHLVGAFQVFSQPLYAAVETWSARRWPNSMFITGGYTKCKINLFKLVWRTCFVVFTTVLGMAMPFFNEILGLLGAIGYWPLTVYFPIAMYISQKKIQSYTSRWVGFQLLNLSCLIVGLAAACGSIQGISKALQAAKPFASKQ